MIATIGARDLTSDGIHRSKKTVLLNADVEYQITKSGASPSNS
jgi:hypothetical protein